MEVGINRKGVGFEGGTGYSPLVADGVESTMDILLCTLSIAIPLKKEKCNYCYI